MTDTCSLNYKCMFIIAHDFPLAASLQGYSITLLLNYVMQRSEKLLVGKTLRSCSPISDWSSPCHPDTMAQSFCDHTQGEWIHHLLGQPMPMFNNPFCERDSSWCPEFLLMSWYSDSIPTIYSSAKVQDPCLSSAIFLPKRCTESPQYAFLISVSVDFICKSMRSSSFV